MKEPAPGQSKTFEERRYCKKHKQEILATATIVSRPHPLPGDFNIYICNLTSEGRCLETLCKYNNQDGPEDYTCQII